MEEEEEERRGRGRGRRRVGKRRINEEHIDRRRNER